jgi:uncharacterized protein YecT (DUF1311 family)
MPIDRSGDPWPGTTYKGFSGASPGAPEPLRAPAAAPRRGPSRRTLMLGGVAAALTLGVLFGLWARPELIGSKPMASQLPPAAAASSAVATPSAAQVPIAVNPPPAAEPLPRAPGRLETLPPEMAAAARLQAQPRTPQAPPAAPTPDLAQAAPQPAAPMLAPVPPAASEPAPAPSFRASFDCGTARPGAEQMVCGDPMLAAEDRQLARAYRRAMRSGVEPEDLRQEQRDWVAIREDAARHSRRALAEVYDQRIQELNQITDAAPEGDQ